MQMNINMIPLVESKIFVYNFDYDEWPGNHHYAGSYVRPFNGNLYNIRDCYRDVFPEDKFEDIINDEEKSKTVKLDRIYKIKYSMNIMP